MAWWHGGHARKAFPEQDEHPYPEWQTSASTRGHRLQTGWALMNHNGKSAKAFEEHTAGRESGEEVPHVVKMRTVLAFELATGAGLLADLQNVLDVTKALFLKTGSRVPSRNAASRSGSDHTWATSPWTWDCKARGLWYPEQAGGSGAPADWPCRGKASQ